MEERKVDENRILK